MKKCPYCGGVNSVKHGVRRTGVGLKRKYLCDSCGRHFTPDEGFNRFRHKSEVISAALDLRAKGLSLADVVNHLDQHYGVKVSRKTISDWVLHFSKKINGHVQTLNPIFGKNFQTNEVFLKVRGNGSIIEMVQIMIPSLSSLIISITNVILMKLFHF